MKGPDTEDSQEEEWMVIQNCCMAIVQREPEPVIHSQHFAVELAPISGLPTFVVTMMPLGRPTALKDPSFFCHSPHA